MSDVVSLKKTIEFYRDLGVDEILSETPVNRFETFKKEAAEKIQNDIIKKEKAAASSDKQNNIIANNFSNMTQSEAIANLARKQVKSSTKIEVNSISDIVAQAKDIVSKIDNVEDLEKAVNDFDGCSLKKMATNTVFSDGDPKSEIMIIGEAPGNDEDLQGIPFCGDDGTLLNAMFGAINRSRKELYITNMLFWRPPGNRRPTSDELDICMPFVQKHIEIIKPKLIVLIGATAMSSILGISDPISKVRGKIVEYNNEFLKEPIKAITLFHPSYLMRQPSKKRLAWEDLNIIDKFLK